MQEFIKQSIRINIIVLLAAALIFLFSRQPLFAAGLLISGAWSTAGFLLTLSLLEIAVLHKPKAKLLLLLLIKFPVLYLLGFCILILRVFPIPSLLAGISSILLVLGVVILWPKVGIFSRSCRT